MEGGDSLEAIPEAVTGGHLLAGVDGAEGEGEAPGTARTGALNLHGAGTELGVAGGDHVEADLPLLCPEPSGVGQRGRVEAAVREVTLIAGTDGEGFERLRIGRQGLLGLAGHARNNQTVLTLHPLQQLALTLPPHQLGAAGRPGPQSVPPCPRVPGTVQIAGRGPHNINLSDLEIC